MRLDFILIAIVSVVSAPAFGASALCRVMLEAIDQASPGESDELVYEILGRVEDWLGKKEIVHKPYNFYGPYVRRRRGKETIHSSFPGKPLSEDDSRVILSLPKKGERTVWATLSPNQKKELVDGLSAILSWGQYDNEMRTGGSRTRDVDWALLLRELKNNEPRDVGLSPTEILRGAIFGKKIGVCRHANAALGGILGELGIPQKDIRFVAGSREPNGARRHIWLEYRVSSRDRWEEVDATPAQETFDRITKGLLGDLLPSLRREYPHRREVITDFLVPRIGD